jgi:hypothetical protein
MDIAHWCVLVPIPKAAAELPVELALRDESMWDVEAPDDVITDIMINPYQLWFESDSYAKDGCLYGRLGYNSGWLYPYTKSVTTYAEWQSLYLGCSAGSVSDGGFTEGLAALDEAFFAEHSLAILYVKEGSGSYRHSVYDIRVEDGELKIGLATLKPEIGTCDMAYWAVLVPIDKEYGDLPVFITK